MKTPAAFLTIALALTLHADAPKEFILFDGKSLDNWQSVDCGGSGKVEIEDGEMRIGTGESLSGVIYKKAADLPHMNYEITLEGKRLEGSDFFCGLTFPVGNLKTSATLVLGGWGGTVTGISSIDGMDAAENSTGHYRRFQDKKWYSVKVRVEPERIQVWVNNENIIDVDTKDKKIGVRPGPIEEYLPLSLTTYQTTAAIKNIKVTPLAKAK